MNIIITFNIVKNRFHFITDDLRRLIKKLYAARLKMISMMHTRIALRRRLQICSWSKDTSRAEIMTKARLQARKTIE